MTAPQWAIQEATQVVQEALGRLNDPQRRTIQMVFFEGMTLREVAEKTSESLSNVRNHYYRGLDRLRDNLSAPPAHPAHDVVIPIPEVGRAKA